MLYGIKDTLLQLIYILLKILMRDVYSGNTPVYCLHFRIL